MRSDVAIDSIFAGILATALVVATGSTVDAGEQFAVDDPAYAFDSSQFTPRYSPIHGLTGRSLLDIPDAIASVADSGHITFHFNSLGPDSPNGDWRAFNLPAPWFATPGFDERGESAWPDTGIMGSVRLEDEAFGYLAFGAAASTGDGPGSGAAYLYGDDGVGAAPVSTGLGDASSLVLSLDGGEYPVFEGFSYRLSGMRRALDEGLGKDETGYAVAGEYSFTLGSMGVAPSVEFVHLDDGTVEDGDTQDFLTKSLRMMWRNWNLAVSHTDRTAFVEGVPLEESRVLSLEAGYGFNFGLNVDAGWQGTEQDGVLEDDYGIRFTYDIDF